MLNARISVRSSGRPSSASLSRRLRAASGAGSARRLFVAERISSTRAYAGSPAVANGVVFVNLFQPGARGGGYAAFKATDGVLLAAHDLDGEDNSSWAPPAISHGTLFLGGASAHRGTLKAYRP